MEMTEVVNRDAVKKPPRFIKGERVRVTLRGGLHDGTFTGTVLDGPKTSRGHLYLVDFDEGYYVGHPQSLDDTTTEMEKES